MRSSFLLYTDSFDWLEELDDAEVGRVFRAIVAHAKDEKVDLSKSEKLAFLPIKTALDRNAEAYLARVERNRENGKKGGRPQIKTETQMVNQETQKTQSVILGFNNNPEKHDSDSDPDSVPGSDSEPKERNTGLLLELIQIVNPREKPTAHRLRLLNGRLKDYTPFELRAAARAFTGSLWHKENNQLSIDNLLAPSKIGRWVALPVEDEDPIYAAGNAEADRRLAEYERRERAKQELLEAAHGQAS